MLTRAKIRHLDHNALGATDLVTRRVRGRGQFPAGAAAWAGSLTRFGPEDVLRGRGGVARGGVVAAGGGGDVAVAAVVLVAGAVFSERGFVGLSGDYGGQGGEEEGLGVHFGL